MMKPKIGIIMGSQSDYQTMQHTTHILDELEIHYDVRVISAHRTPEAMIDYAKQARENGLQVIIAGAGGAAHLPGMVAACTTLPVIGVPVQSKALNGLDSLLSIVQMPAGVPVATVAIGEAGAKNAGLLAAQLLGMTEPGIANKLDAYRIAMRQAVEATSDLREVRGC